MEVVGQGYDHHVGIGVVDCVFHRGCVVRDPPSVLEGKPPLFRPGIHNFDTIPATLTMERHRVEITDQTGPEHRDGVALHWSNSFD